MMYGSDAITVPLAMLGLHLHFAFATLWIVGMVFLITWGIRIADKDTLRTWALWLLIIGIAGSILTAGFASTCMKKYGAKGGGMMNNGMMRMMMDNQMDMRIFKGTDAGTMPMMQGGGMMQ